MKLVTCSYANTIFPAVVDYDAVIPIDSIINDAPSDMLGIIGGGLDLFVRLKARVSNPNAIRIPLSEVALLPPIPRPIRNVICVGKNYFDHAYEFEASGFDSSSAGQAKPDYPIFFTKATSSVIGDGGSIDASMDPDDTLDYEGELAVIVGKGGRKIAANDVFDHIFGYTILNDITARNAQHKHKQWFLGKSGDTFCPMGPSIITSDEISHIGDILLETRVNGELRQRASVKDLIFDIPTLIETLSRSITLVPGDIIATGTPAGVGIGFSPPKYLMRGDVVSVAIGPIGVLTNRVV